MEKISPLRKAIGGALLFLILAMIFYSYINRNVLFMNEAEIQYSDGCVEKYIDGELVSEVCEYGRELLEQQEEQLNNPNKYLEVPK